MMNIQLQELQNCTREVEYDSDYEYEHKYDDEIDVAEDEELLIYQEVSQLPDVLIGLIGEYLLDFPDLEVDEPVLVDDLERLAELRALAMN
jgi:hypothetical protein